MLESGNRRLGQLPPVADSGWRVCRGQTSLLCKGVSSLLSGPPLAGQTLRGYRDLATRTTEQVVDQGHGITIHYPGRGVPEDGRRIEPDEPEGGSPVAGADQLVIDHLHTVAAFAPGASVDVENPGLCNGRNHVADGG